MLSLTRRIHEEILVIDRQTGEQIVVARLPAEGTRSRSGSRHPTGSRSCEGSCRDESGAKPAAERADTAILIRCVSCPPARRFQTGDRGIWHRLQGKYLPG